MSKRKCICCFFHDLIILRGRSKRCNECYELTEWKVPTVYSKIDDRLKKQPMGQEDLLQFQPTVYHREYDKMMSGREDICYVTNQEALLGNVGF